MAKGLSSRPIEVLGTNVFDRLSLVEARNHFTGRTIGGLAAVYGKRSTPLGGYTEIVEPSCFHKSESDHWPGAVCRFEHDMLLGTTAAGTLKLANLTEGLDYTVDLPDTTAGNDTLALVRRGDVRNSSFAFQVYDQDWTHDEGLPVRHLLSARLIDVAPVSIPAYPDASVGLRSLAEWADAEMDDVVALSNQNALCKLFTRTDRRLPGISEVSARLAKYPKAPTDPATPAVAQEGRTMTGQQAQLEVLRMTPKPSVPVSGREALLQTLAHRYPKPPVTPMEARARIEMLRLLPFQAAELVGLDG